MDLKKQCANCGYNHGGECKDGEGNLATKCPRCNFPIGFPRQRLTEADGTPIAPKTAEELAELEAAGAKSDSDAEAKAPGAPEQDAPPQAIPLTGEVAATENAGTTGNQQTEDEGHAG